MNEIVLPGPHSGLKGHFALAGIMAIVLNNKIINQRCWRASFLGNERNKLTANELFLFGDIFSTLDDTHIHQHLVS